MASSILTANSGAIDNALGTVSKKLVSEDDGSTYTTFTPDSAYLNSDGTGNSRALISSAIDLARRNMAEGAVLLKNENNALPLSKGSKVTLLGARSHVNILNSGMGQKSQGCYISLEDALSATKTDFNNRKIVTTGWGASTPEAIDDFNFSDLKYGGTGAEAGARFELNPTTIAAYEATTSSLTLQPAAAKVYKVGEPSIDDLKGAANNFEASFATYNDAAIVVVGRGAGESNDYIKGGLDESEKTDTITEPLQLTQNELDIINLACEKFSKVIVLLNTNSAMEIGALKDNSKVSAILWIGHPGNYGSLGVADILCGNVNPSGGLYDIYATNNLSAPAMQNMGDYTWANADSITRSKSTKYVLEAEGIYVGYRYYETRYYDSVGNPTNLSNGASSSAGVYASTGSSWNYGQEVAYGFGYGLSYTTFKYEMTSVNVTYPSAHEIYADVTVKVTNTGTVAGKTYVQVYGQAPYTQYDVTNKIEKSAIQLLNFDKTEIIQPGSSETITVQCDLQNIATYDNTYKNADGSTGTYILENGDYYFSVGNGAHEAVNNILVKQGKGSDTNMVGTGDAALTYVWTYKNGTNGIDATTFGISKNNTQVSNQIDYIDWNQFGGEKVTYLSRSNWQTTYPKEYISLSAPSDMMDYLNGKYYTVKTGEDTSSVVWNSKSTDYKFYQMVLSDYDDYRWDDLLSQISLEQATVFASNAGPTFTALDGIGFVSLTSATDNAGNGIVFTLKNTKDANAPWSITTGNDSNWNGQVFGSAPLVASTFDPDIMLEIGEFVGNEALFVGLPIVWGPGLNTHRHAYNGRNGEYYSEDPVLAGTAAMEFAVGARRYGLIAAAKHFVFNDQETNRNGVAPFMTEQRAREVELRAYQIAIEAVKYDGEGLIGIMTSFSKCGPVEVTCSEGMLTGILQNEWGFHGYAVTDISDDTDLYACMVHAGATGFDLRFGYPTDTSDFASKFTNQSDGNTVSTTMFSGDLTMQNILKTSLKRTLWTFTQSNLMNRYSATTHVEEQMTWWHATCISLIVVFSVLTAAGVALYAVSVVKTRNKEDE
jgi:beta-glucosidase